ncbi:hypothetical protein M8494_14525 [Serratia ureilytica]
MGMAVISRLQLQVSGSSIQPPAPTGRRYLANTRRASDIVIRERILGTPNVTEIVECQSQRDVDTRDLLITATLNTAFSQTSVTTYV